MSKGLYLHAGDGVIARDGTGNVLLAYGTTVPSDGADGFHKGCLFLHVDGTANQITYINAGSTTSADFNALGAAGVAQGAALTAQLTSITIADANASPDYAIQSFTNSTAWGFADEAELISFAYVVQNLQVRLAEVEARLEAAGIVAAN